MDFSSERNNTGSHGALPNQNKVENINWNSLSRKGAMLTEKRCEDPLPVQWIYITSRNRTPSS